MTMPDDPVPVDDLTARDLIAIAALAGIIASSAHPNAKGKPNEQDAARWAFEYADAFLAWRENGQ